MYQTNQTHHIIYHIRQCKANDSLRISSHAIEKESKKKIAAPNTSQSSYKIIQTVLLGSETQTVVHAKKKLILHRWWAYVNFLRKQYFPKSVNMLKKKFLRLFVNTRPTYF